MCGGVQEGQMKALIALEDGTVFEGKNFGIDG